MEHNHYHEETLRKHMSGVLANMETNFVLFETLLCLHPPRLRPVKNVNGYQTDYYLYLSNLKK
jgi:hypothetical protein